MLDNSKCCCDTYLNFWLFSLISILLQRFLNFLHLVRLFSLPSLLLSPLSPLLITQAFAFQLPPPPLFLLLFPDSLNNINTGYEAS